MMTDSICQALIKDMTGRGWTLDVNDEKRLGFIMPVDERTEWFRDYNKQTSSFVQGNGKQIINLIVKRENAETTE